MTDTTDNALAEELERLHAEGARRNSLLPGLDHIANFLNSLDTEDMTPNQVRSAIYSECLEPGCKSTPNAPAEPSEAVALLRRAGEFACKAPQFDWSEDRCIMNAVHLAEDILRYLARIDAALNGRAGR